MAKRTVREAIRVTSIDDFAKQLERAGHNVAEAEVIPQEPAAIGDIQDEIGQAIDSTELANVKESDTPSSKIYRKSSSSRRAAVEPEPSYILSPQQKVVLRNALIDGVIEGDVSPEEFIETLVANVITLSAQDFRKLLLGVDKGLGRKLNEEIKTHRLLRVKVRRKS